MRPVSSDTTIATASECCDIPIAALCLNPSSRGMLRSWLTGNIHPAAFNRIFDIIMAPSCSGEFLKNMFSIRRWLIFASTKSPVSTISSSGVARSITIRAPHFCLAMLMQAITIGIIASRSTCPFSDFLSFTNHFRNDDILLCPPMEYRNLRISSWKSTMIAIVPTPTNLSKMAPSSLISNT